MSKLLRDFVRIENDFTIIPNEVLRNKEMKSSTKNILLTMISLPPTWDFSIAGIAACVYEGRETVQKALVELEKIGYITRKRERRDNGTLGAMVYTIHQFPVSEDKNTYKKNFSNQDVKNQKQVKQVLDSKTQLRTDNKLRIDNNINTEPTNSSTAKALEDNIPSSFQRNKGNRSSKNQLTEGDTDYTKPEIHKFLKQKIHEQMEYSEVGLDEYFESCITPIVIYFYDSYNETFIEQHPVLSNIAYRKIIDAYLNPPKVMENEDIDFETYKRMIDKYFATDIGKRSGKKVDYHINHFMGKQVREYMYRRIMDEER